MRGLILMIFDKRDLELYISRFGEEEILYFNKKIFNYNDNGKKKQMNSSIFLTRKDLTIISHKNSFVYRIPLGYIYEVYTTKKLLSYYVHFKYSYKNVHFESNIDFVSQTDGENFKLILELLKDVERKKVEFEQKENDAYSEIEKVRIETDMYIKEKHEELDKEIQNQRKCIDNYKEEQVKQIKNEVSSLSTKIENRKATINYLENQINSLRDEIDKYNNILSDKIFNSDYKDVLVRHFEKGITSKELTNKLSLLTLDEKEMIKNKEAVNYFGIDFKKREINAQVKQILRSFNTECDYIFSQLNARNYEKYHNKIIKVFETLNRIYEIDKVEISRNFLEIKLNKLNLINERAIKIEQEKELQREIKAQMKEEEKVRRELELEEKKIEKEEKQFNKEVKSLFKRLEKSQNDVEKELYAEKIKQLEAKLKLLENDKKNLENRQANTRAGYVYVISNIGSFGENIYKIGLTRRLEPYDRVKELGDASVPFEFDVHAMIFSEDAPTLETTLHRHFRDRELNKVNHRKEFFKVNINEIEEVVKNNHNNTVEFTKIPIASDYWESQNILNKTSQY